MVFCPHCKADCPAQRDSPYYVCCDVCGKVLSDDYFTDEPTFIKGPGGESRRSGVNVRSTESGYSDSFRRTLEKGTNEIRYIVSYLRIGGGDSIMNPASRFYEVAVQRNFTRGRRTIQVAAACLYIACRTIEPPKPFLLIDFSETLQINVYVLGSVFLQLCQLLSLVEHNIIKRPVDPTLFIPRFTEKLLDGRNVEVSRTAMHIIASMKRDWMQTGRKPSGLCGAALYISALSHGFKFSKSDIVKIVHICEVTLTKRLIEFENTESGSLTIEELDNNAKELTKCKLPSFGSQNPGKVLCQHKDEPHFAHGLCKSCFSDFVELSGGLEGGSDPPAFQQAERMRAAMESAKHSNDSDTGDLLQKEKPMEFVNKAGENVDSFVEDGQNMTSNEKLNTTKFGSDASTDGTSDAFDNFKDTNTLSGAESDGLSDIDDIEVCGYLNNEEEMHYKKIIWEEMNREYLEEQAAKMEAGQGDPLSKSKPKKERRKKQDPNAPPAQTAAEAARQMLSKKRFSSKINYDALEKCFAEDMGSNKKTKLTHEEDDNNTEFGLSAEIKGHKSKAMDKENEYNEGEEDIEDDGYRFDKKSVGHEWQYEEDGYDYGYEDDEY